MEVRAQVAMSVEQGRCKVAYILCGLSREMVKVLEGRTKPLSTNVVCCNLACAVICAAQTAVGKQACVLQVSTHTRHILLC